MKNLTNALKSYPWITAFLALVAVRVVMLYLVYIGIPDLGIDKEGWITRLSGDELDYFKSAKALLSFNFVPNAFPIGFSIFLAPFVWVLNAESFDSILKPLALIHSILFYTAVSIMVYLLAKKFLQTKNKALVITSIFLFYPYIFYVFFNFLAKRSDVIENFKITRFSQLMFLNVLSDPLSMLLMLSSLLLMLKIYNKESIKISVGLGFILSFAVITRFQNVILGPVFAIILLWQKKFKNFAYFAIASIPLLLFQLYANFRSNGALFKNVYGEQWQSNFNAPVVSISYPLKILEYSINYSPLLLAPFVAAIILLCFGIKRVIKNTGQDGIILTIYSISILGFISILAPTFLNPRYFLPIAPPLMIFIYAGAEDLYLYIKEKYKRNANNIK